MADILFPHEPADAYRAHLRQRIERSMSLKEASLAAGLPADYLHRYVYLALPPVLPADVLSRLTLALGLGVRALEPPPDLPPPPPTPPQVRLPVWVVAASLIEALTGAAAPCRIETRARAVPAAGAPTHLFRMGMGSDLAPRDALVVACARRSTEAGTAVMVYFPPRRLFVPARVSACRAGRHALRCAITGGEAWLLSGYRLLPVVEVLSPPD